MPTFHHNSSKKTNPQESGFVFIIINRQIVCLPFELGEARLDGFAFFDVILPFAPLFFDDMGRRFRQKSFVRQFLFDALDFFVPFVKLFFRAA
ncbi:hypothetical protein LR69_00186 [Geobacillus sp. BCO2]|nr:hypothetical protein LR69_00186 [Geobacillus sp. BCO2]